MTFLEKSPDWWRGAVIYQIYPRSFQDTNGDGVGDRPTVDVIKGRVGEDFLGRAVKTYEYFINGAVKNHIVHRAEEARRGMGIIAIFSAAEIQLFRAEDKNFLPVIKKIAFPYEFGDKFCFRIMVNRIGIIVLLDFPLIHDNDAVAHGEGFFLIMGDEYESKAKFFLQVFQLDLERFAELVIKSAERFV